MFILVLSVLVLHKFIRVNANTDPLLGNQNNPSGDDILLE